MSWGVQRLYLAVSWLRHRWILSGADVGLGSPSVSFPADLESHLMNGLIAGGKELLLKIVSMLSGLVNRFDGPADVLHEDSVEYHVEEVT